ncbi:MAG: sodium:solute symporter [Mucilaginibacter sp.]|nr:sodium:solute symporter [Mucilaginibacter sp.]
MQRRLIYTGIVIMLLTTPIKAQESRPVSYFSWGELPAIPDKYGFAGSFAGVSNGSLIVAGGANFPDGGGPWTGAKKTWTAKIFVLEKSDGRWKEAGKLPMPLGYGVSVTWHNQLICFGGSNAGGHYKNVISISYKNGKISISKLPDMPAALANSSGALAGHTVYIAGGLVNPDDKHAARNFWSIDLSQPVTTTAWTILESWPGPERMLSVSGTQNGSFYLFSGTALVDDGKGAVKRRYLNDAYEYTPGKGWKKLSDMPFATVAAANPAYATKQNRLLIFGGDNGRLVKKAAILKDKHPGFSNQILCYNPGKNSWSVAGEIYTHKKADVVTHPNGSVWAPVTTTLVLWNGELIFPGGEVRPAVRTPRVLKVVPNLK